MTHLLGVIPGAAPLLLVAGADLADAARSIQSPPPVPVGEGIAVVVAEPGTPPPPGARWAPARTALPDLPPSAQPIALRALAVANWRSRARFCPACGGPVEPTAHGYNCLREDRPVFPRTDPCVITAILDSGGRLLLCHAANHPDRLYTLVAGFVEAGESLEDAVRREALEEVGVEVSRLQFIRSQPWPFPGSLMASFSALASAEAITVDGREILDAAWFTRAELTHALNSGAVALPLDYSVARQTIESWRTGRGWRGWRGWRGEVPRP